MGIRMKNVKIKYRGRTPIIWYRQKWFHATRHHRLYLLFWVIQWEEG